MANPSLREFIYLDTPRVRSLAAQLGVSSGAAADPEQLMLALEPALLPAGKAIEVDSSFDFGRWTPQTFADGSFVRASGVVRLLDFSYLALALRALPAVLRKMSKIEMEALRNSDEGRRMSKTALQQRSHENQNAIAKVEEFKMDELNDAVRQLYGDVVRVKLRPNRDQPNAVLMASASLEHFTDSPAAMSQKYGVEIDAGWTLLGQVNAPNITAPPQPMPTGNQLEDSFEQIALLMNNAFRLANSPAWPAVSVTPIAIYRRLG